MSDPIKMIERCLAAYNRHDAAAFASYFAPDGMLHIVATGESSEGRDAIQTDMEQRWQALDYTLETRGLYDCGGDVWLEWTMRGTHIGDMVGIPATHLRFELPGCSHFTLAPDGSIARDDVYFDFAAVLRQLGMLPEPEAPQPHEV